jgi:ABC-type transport system involved in multi-copper enzyme maturation permease subunit
MIRLIKLELQHINLRPYFISSAILGMVLLLFTYFVAYVAQVEQETQFMTYTNIFRFTCAISIMLFGILSSAMYAKLVIAEYSEKRLALLFSYPISRQKIFLAKVMIVSFFVLISMLLCMGISILIFAATESVAPIVSDTMTIDLFIETFKITFLSLIAVIAIGLLSMRIGFIKKSVSITLISAFVLSGVYGNIVVGAYGNFPIALPIVGISLFVILMVLLMLSNKINHMEVE